MRCAQAGTCGQRRRPIALSRPLFHCFHPPTHLLGHREAAQLARALAELHGGLPALLAATAAEVPEAAAHMAPSSAAIASALFVAANEFLVAEGEGDAALAAEGLMQGGWVVRCRGSWRS